MPRSLHQMENEYYFWCPNCSFILRVIKDLPKSMNPLVNFDVKTVAIKKR